MIEDLIALDLPPGLVNNGTAYQTKGRWRVGNLVRFFQKTIQPIGGWVQRVTSGATISGTPNACIAWQDNAGNSWLAIGTSSHLYLVSSANVVTDITPTTGFPAGTHTWQLAVFGSYLIAVDSLPAYVALYGGGSGYANTFYWSDATNTPTATQAFDAFGVWPGPQSVYGVVNTPERFLMLLRGADPNGRASRVSPEGAPNIN